MRHPTYKHLEARLRLGAFSLGQWTQITAAGVAAALFGGYLSPFPTQVTIFVSVVGAGLPVAVSYGAMGLEFSVAQFARAGWGYWRQPRRFLAGPGEPTTGYAVLADQVYYQEAEAADPSTSGGALLWDV
jgi:hypothetical protein